MTERISTWLESLRGKALLRAEAALMTEALDDCFGWELVQVGAWGEARELVAGGRTRRRTIVASPEWGTVVRTGPAPVSDRHSSSIFSRSQKAAPFPSVENPVNVASV